ncbi:hypothetical protein BD410DRAFT_19674 [Rickenella mellea]|uniref:Uncharacterized protein n=1 Tax=Rickenella mellea TaxID=50990 RepID=A0A4R5XE57_9AGAM|nr:hypothetical protein BD410DRAFT_19674 [Rickenella mellea]
MIWMFSFLRNTITSYFAVPFVHSQRLVYPPHLYISHTEASPKPTAALRTSQWSAFNFGRRAELRHTRKYYTTIKSLRRQRPSSLGHTAYVRGRVIHSETKLRVFRKKIPAMRYTGVVDYPVLGVTRSRTGTNQLWQRAMPDVAYYVRLELQVWSNGYIAESQNGKVPSNSRFRDGWESTEAG